MAPGGRNAGVRIDREKGLRIQVLGLQGLRGNSERMGIQVCELIGNASMRTDRCGVTE